MSATLLASVSAFSKAKRNAVLLPMPGPVLPVMSAVLPLFLTFFFLVLDCPTQSLLDLGEYLPTITTLEAI
jgi:hypothetical protein